MQPKIVVKSYQICYEKISLKETPQNNTNIHNLNCQEALKGATFIWGQGMCMKQGSQVQHPISSFIM